MISQTILRWIGQNKMLFSASERDFTQVSGPKLCAHNAIKINILDYADYFIAHKMRYREFFEVILNRELILTGLVSVYFRTKVFIDFDNIPEGKIQYGFSLNKNCDDIIWADELSDFSNYIKSDWSSEGK